MSNSDSSSALACLVSLAILGGLIFAAVMLIQRNSREAHKTEQLYTQLVQQLPQDKQMIFMMQYNNVKKNGVAAVLLALFLGGIGGHKFYMGQAGWGVLYLLFCWTMIPAAVAFVEAFLLPGSVNQYNQRKMTEIAAALGMISAPSTAGSLP